MAGLLQGDLGPSYRYRDYTVAELIGNAFPYSLKLGALAMALALLVGFLAALARLRLGWKSGAFLAGLLAFHLSGLFFFEEHLNNPTFVILTAWFVVLAASGRRDRPS